METLIAVHEIHGIEVAGKKTVVAPGKPFVPNSAKQRDTLLKNGAAKMPPKVVEQDDDEPEKPEGLQAMTVKALQKYAADKEIDLGEAKLKNDIIAAIEAAEKAAAENAGNDDDQELV